MPQRDCIIDSNRNNSLLHRLRSGISKRNFKAMTDLVKDLCKPESNILQEITKDYLKYELKMCKSKEYQAFKLSVYLWNQCCDSQTKKKIRSFHLLTSILSLRNRQKFTLRRIASQLNVSLNKTTSSWNQIRVTKCKCITELYDDICQEILTTDFLLRYFEQIKVEKTRQLDTLKIRYQNSVKLSSHLYCFTFTKFYLVFKRYGYPYSSIKYAQRQFRVVEKRHLQNFLLVYLFMPMFQCRFLVVFVDQSSVCPSLENRL